MRSLLLLSLFACGDAKTDTESTDVETTDTENADPTPEEATDVGPEPEEATPVDDTDPDEEPPAGALALAGVWTANNPSESCYATILNDTTVEIDAADASHFTISDGTHTFACTWTDGAVSCPQISGTTTGIAIAPGVYCDWPYVVDLGVTISDADHFNAAVSFTTSPSPTSESCAWTLGACTGSNNANFTRWTPAAADEVPPPAQAMVRAQAL